MPPSRRGLALLVEDVTLLKQRQVTAQVRFLVSDQSAYVTSSSVRVDGGWLGSP